VRNCRSILALASLAAVLAFAASALANQTFHTLTAPLMSVNGAPLQNGWVHDIHMNGNRNSGQERYHVAGAIPNTSLQVVIQFYGNATCAGTATPIPTAVLTTNGAGNANGQQDFAASPGPPPPPVDDSAIWQLVGPDGAVDYTTTCHLVIIGGK
jgi:hypothetical protein